MLLKLFSRLVYNFLMPQDNLSLKASAASQGWASQACPQEEVVLRSPSEADDPLPPTRAACGLREEQAELQVQRGQQQEQEEDEEVQAGVNVQLLQLQHMDQGLPGLSGHVVLHSYIDQIDCLTDAFTKLNHNWHKLSIIFLIQPTATRIPLIEFIFVPNEWRWRCFNDYDEIFISSY